MDTDYDLDMASDFGKKVEQCEEEMRKMEEKVTWMAQEMKRTAEKKRKAEKKRGKLESKNRNLGSYFVILEMRVENQRKEKDDRNRGKDILREKSVCVL